MATTVAAATQKYAMTSTPRLQFRVTDDSSPVPLPEIPVKLRCNICSGLARGAVRLPCCEQAICETCGTLPKLSTDDL
jgi:hypothetical protein